MSTFEITGTIAAAQTLTSSKGNPYFTFNIVDDAGKTFELSLFGDGMGMANKITKGAKLTVKGMLSSREYQDKNGKTRYGMDLRTQWIEAIGGDKSGPKYDASATLPQTDMDSIPF